MPDIQPTKPVQVPVSPATPSSDKIHLRVRNRAKVLFDEDVKALSSRNDTGLFDVLPEHANFISLINRKLIVHKLDGNIQEIPLNNGIIKVKDNAIRCYIDLLAPEAVNQQTPPPPTTAAKK